MEELSILIAEENKAKKDKMKKRKRIVKKKSIKDFTIVYNIWKRQQTTMPDHTVPKDNFNDRTANELTKMIIAFTTMLGGALSRINVTGIRRKIKGKMMWTKSGSTKGKADLAGPFAGKSLDVEVKIGKDKLSQKQIDQMNKVRSAGGIYIIAKDFDQWLNDFGKYFPEHLSQYKKICEDILQK